MSDKLRLMLLSIGLVWACPAALPQAAPEFTRTEDFSSVGVSYDDLLKVVLQANRLLDSVNTSVKASCRQSLTLTGTAASIVIPGIPSAEALQDAPPISYSLIYDYSCREAPISRVKLDFYDFRREMQVSGGSKEHVQALMALMSDDIRQWESPFGGLRSRNWAGLVLFLVGASLAFISYVTAERKLGIAVSSLGLAMMLSTWILPWKGGYPELLSIRERPRS